MDDQSWTYPSKVFDRSEHYYYLTETGLCPANQKFLDESSKSKPVNDSFQYFNSSFGHQLMTLFPALTFKTFSDLEHFCEGYVCNHVDNRTNAKKIISSFQDPEVFYQECLSLLDTNVFDAWYGGNASFIAQVAYSFITNDILTWMDNKILGLQEKKYVIYSLHDGDISGIQVFLNLALGSNFRYYPKFASTVTFELVYYEEKSIHMIHVIFGETIIWKEEYSNFKAKLRKIIKDKTFIYDYCGFNPKGFLAEM